tara:strand:- start:212 stop:628 length:417 start_codon:yes stop_codon:yes gene_type:complete
MFSFGWGEILLIVVVIVVVVGPKDIPRFLRQLGTLSKSIKKISREFKSSLNEITEESEFKDLKKSISEVKDLKKDFDIKKNFKNEINTIKESASIVEKEISDIKNSEDDDEENLIETETIKSEEVKTELKDIKSSEEK